MGHPTRMWNYWLGGKDNFAVDRAAGDEYMLAFPGVVDVARASRQFLIRSVRILAEAASLLEFGQAKRKLLVAQRRHERRGGGWNRAGGLDLVEPGGVTCPQWRPDDDTTGPTEVYVFGGVGRKR